MKFTATIVALVAAAASVAAAPTDSKPTQGMFSHPADAPDGLYTHHIGLDGNRYTSYHGKLRAANQTAPAGQAASKRGGMGAKCEALNIQADDRAQAVSALAGNFATTNEFHGSISAKHGTAVAYGYDYGNGQTISSQDLQNYLNIVSNDCGDWKGGHYDLPSWKASYGVTNNGAKFC